MALFPTPFLIKKLGDVLPQAIGRLTQGSAACQDPNYGVLFHTFWRESGICL